MKDNFIIVDGAINVLVNPAGSFNIPYPAGTTANTFYADGHILILNGQRKYTDPSQAGIAFGVSNITITNSTTQPWRPGDLFEIQLNSWPTHVFDGDTYIERDLYVGGVRVIGSDGQSTLNLVFSNVNSLTAYAKTAAILNGALINVSGFYAAGDGGGGNFFVRNAGGGEVANNGTTFLLLDGRIAERIFQGNIRIKWFGAKADGLTNNSAAINAAAAACATAGDALSARKCGLTLDPGVYNFSTMLTFDLGKYSVKGEGTFLTHTGTTGTAIKLVSTMSYPYAQVQNSLEGFQLNGAGLTNATRGLSFGGADNTGPSHISIVNVNVTGFGTGWYLDENSYALSFINSDVSSNATNIYGPTGANSGERWSFNGCTIFGATVWNVNLEQPSGEMFFQACSIDYPGQSSPGVLGGLVRCNGGYISMVQTHLEWGTDLSSPQIIVTSANGATVDLHNCSLHQLNRGVVTNNYWFTNDGDLLISDCFMHGMASASGYWGSGTGSTIIRGTRSYGVPGFGNLTIPSCNLMQDGGFEDTNFLDLIYVTNDTGAISDPHFGSNIGITLSPTVVRTGAKSLRIEKPLGAGSLSGFSIAVPLHHRSINGRIGGRWWIKSTLTGSLLNNFYFASISYVDGGFPKLIKNQNIGDFTSTGPWASWTTQGFQPFNKIPVWATHYVIDISLFSIAGPGYLYIDDFEIYQM